jgi:hypothetical protein
MKNRVNFMCAVFMALVLCSWENKNPKNNYFEGTVSYKINMIEKNSDADPTSLRNLYGKSSQLFFKEGDFLEKYQGGLITEELYRKQDNKMYFKRNYSNTLFWNDCGKPGDRILKFEFNPKKEKILGIDCDELKIYYNDKIISDYYNAAIFSINPDWSGNFILDGENEIDQKEKAVCLKHKIEYPGFTILITATSFTKQKINSNIFKIPPGEVLTENK